MEEKPSDAAIGGATSLFKGGYEVEIKNGRTKDEEDFL